MAGGQNHATMRIKLKSALSHKKLANQILDQILSTQTKWNATLDKLNADSAVALDINYSSLGALSGVFAPDAAGASQHKASLRKSLRSALAHKKLADEICDSLVAMQSKYNSLLTKLDAEAGTLNDVNYASTLGMSVINAASGIGMENQHKASRRTSLRSALAHRNLADELLSSISGFQSSFNSVMAKLDLATINGVIATHKVAVISPDSVA